MASLTPHVLIVDDEPALRKVLRTSLGANGFAIDEARSGEEAVDILLQRNFDLVLLDINMPGIGEWKPAVRFARWLRKLGS